MLTAKTALLLGKDERGVSMIEMALALPVLSLVLLGLVDVSSCYSAQMSLQQAAARSLERVQVAEERRDFSYVRTEAATAAGVPESQVTVDTWLECNDVRQTSYDSSCTSAQRSARYIQVTITSAYSPVFIYSPLGVRQSDGKIALTASSAVRVQ
jgi:Flp pilus assembly protein TadG